MADNPIRQLMNPSSIAFVGASNRFTSMGTIQCMNLIAGGYPGEVLPVHPKESTVLGKKAYRNIADLPYAPELAVLVVPTRLVLDMVEDFGRLGTRSMVIVTGGFRETGDQGRGMEKTLVERARHYGIRFLGPNCLGIVNTHLPLNITVGPMQDHDGSLGLASQSGTYVAQVVSYLHRSGIVLSKAVSVGNEADINLIDCIEYLGEDEHTRAIGLYIEGIRDAARFLDVASKVSRIKPIVAQYVGGTEAGARSGSSHTGAMAGPSRLYEALFEQAGIIGVESIEDVYKTGWALATQPPLRGKRVAILTNSGGPGTGIAHTCNRGGLEVPEFSREMQEKVSAFLPGHASARNPVDLTFHTDMKALTEEIPRVLFSSDEVDGVIIHGIMDTAFMELLHPVLEKFAKITKEDLIKMASISMDALVSMPERFGKPLLISSFFGKEDHCIQTFHERHIPTFDAPEKAGRAMGALFRHLQFRSRPMEKAEDPGSPPAEALRIVEHASQIGFDEFSAKRLLKVYGIPTPREALSHTLEETLLKAREIGYPVVLKACSPTVAHKTELGFVHLNLKDEAGLEAAYRSIRGKDGDSPLLVAQMLKGDRELMAGITRHPGFPPCVVFGLGGVLTEALDDITLRLAPLAPHEASEMVDGISSRRILGHYRGMPPVDRAALNTILMALGRISIHFPHIREIDLNPMIVVNGKPFVADALVIV
ncbi:MAG TPA: acetate--CoA ligase family protein [Deltaproteobacteria bacterium]|nr:acetate--CoA ligase family protein [Deltaproteobacteria bacterium]HPR53580.1 acetate--CoA ligase family protein [Deltaproteobacteria bacterium]